MKSKIDKEAAKYNWTLNRKPSNQMQLISYELAYMRRPHEWDKIPLKHLEEGREKKTIRRTM